MKVCKFSVIAVAALSLFSGSILAGNASLKDNILGVTAAPAPASKAKVSKKQHAAKKSSAAHANAKHKHLAAANSHAKRSAHRA